MSVANLDTLLPTDDETDFLVACLADGDRSIPAWARWSSRATRDGTSIGRALVPLNAFLPLLYWNLRRVGADLDARLATHLRAARLTESLRLRHYTAIVAGALQVLDRASVPCVVLKGAALGATVYPDPLYRHADDIDLLVHDVDLARATAALAEAGWSIGRPPVLPGPLHHAPLVDTSGVEVELHRRLVIPFYTLPYPDLLSRAETATVAGVPARVLSPEDALVHVCAHGLAGPRILRWVADAWFILGTGQRFDWPRCVDIIRAGRLRVPLDAALGYLARRMDLPIPSDVVEALHADAARAGWVERQAARPWPQAGRLRRLCPPPVQFALHYDVSLAAVPWLYLRRLVGYIRR